MKIIDDVYALDSTKGNYAYLISGEETILVDSGRPGQGKSIISELDSLRVKPMDIDHILFTHHDIDHIGNAAFLQQATGASLWASKEDIPYIYGDVNRPGIKKFLSFFMRVEKPKDINSYGNGGIDGVGVISTPGHTPGHVCLLYKDVLFAGDLVRSNKGELNTLASFMNVNDDTIMESIKKLDSYSFNWICPAHGEPVKRDGLWKRLLKN
jgi:glyoxylase-like metal-dependent hydrolase (beta-lactamase superfamily II)